MIPSLKTENQTLQKIFEPPIIGPIVIFLIAIAPVPLLFIINAIFPLDENSSIEQYNALVAGLWNLLLTFGLKIKINIFFIPCWLLFTIIGTLRYFQIIG